MHLIFDYDFLVYRIGFAVQKTLYELMAFDSIGNVVASGTFESKQLALDAVPTGVDVAEVALTPVVQAEPVENALHLIKEQINKSIEKCGGDSYEGFLTGKDNFRDKIATIKPYKGNRDPSHKPVHYQAIRDYLARFHRAQIVDGIEADDAVMTRYFALEGADRTIVAVDKDFLQAPVRLYNPVKDKHLVIEEEEARHNFWIQVLAGDATDNIQGIKGMGPQSAARALAGCTTDEHYYKRAKACYEDAYELEPSMFNGLEGRIALAEACRLVYLLRHETDRWSPPL